MEYILQRGQFRIGVDTTDEIGLVHRSRRDDLLELCRMTENPVEGSLITFDFRLLSAFFSFAPLLLRYPGPHHRRLGTRPLETRFIGLDVFQGTIGVPVVSRSPGFLQLAPRLPQFSLVVHHGFTGDFAPGQSLFPRCNRALCARITEGKIHRRPSAATEFQQCHTDTAEIQGVAFLLSHRPAPASHRLMNSSLV